DQLNRFVASDSSRNSENHCLLSFFRHHQLQNSRSSKGLQTFVDLNPAGTGNLELTLPQGFCDFLSDLERGSSPASTLIRSQNFLKMALRLLTAPSPQLAYFWLSVNNVVVPSNLVAAGSNDLTGILTSYKS